MPWLAQFSVCYGARLQQLLESIAVHPVALWGTLWGNGSVVVTPYDAPRGGAIAQSLNSFVTQLLTAAQLCSFVGHGTVWWLSDKLRSCLTTEEGMCLAKRVPSQAAIDVQRGADMDTWVLHSSSALGSSVCERAVFYDIWHVAAEGS